MVQVSKRYREAEQLRECEGSYTVEEAVGVLTKMPAAKFDETVELAAHLGVNPKQTTQMVRGTVRLPHGSGKTVKVLAFTENPDAAKEAGADFAGLDDMIAKVQEGWMDFDVAVATPAAMKKVRTVARVLGPRGLMPNPKAGTVSDDLVKAITEVKAGRVEYKMDKTSNVAVPVGKRSFSAEQIVENIQTVIESLGNARPEGFKGSYIKNISLSATMSPSVRLESSIYTKF